MPKGFISIDCGIVEGSTYTDNVTGINYVSDTDFIDSGQIHNILPIYNSFTVDTQLTTLTSFPQNTRNCYTLKPTQGKGNRYLIRARFMYGNYDFNWQLPEFDVYLGPDYWDTMKFNSSSKPRSDRYLYENRSTNYNFLDPQTRYKADEYDRLWSPINWPNSTFLYTLDKVSTGLFTTIDPPSEVMSTAITPRYPKDSFNIAWNPDNTTDKFFMYMHFAEIEILKQNQTREFNIYLNGNLSYGPFSPLNHTTTTIYSTEPEIVAPSYTLAINKTKNSTLPPIINALELYTLKHLPQRQTDDQDATAMWSIKSSYIIRKNWQGDPCAPQEFVWDGVRCSYNDTGSPRIVSLNLSTSGLNGEIDPGLANLTMMHTLDLSNNNLTGAVPSFLSGMNFLKVLNLKGNNFIGTIPAGLLAKANKGSLTLSFDGESTGDTLSSCGTNRCKRNRDSKIIVPVVATVASLFVILIALTAIWMIRKQMASGLEYLHHGCKPPIVHRDVKCTNILLNGTFQAKLADFGLSKAFPSEGGSHISTAVAGTPGYLDPEYYTSNWLTEKSDVYSFGVVLLVIITGQPAITKYDKDNMHISRWVNLMLADGNVKNIVDPRLLGDFDINSAWKAVELAMACVARTPSRRPTMNEVVMELNDCLIFKPSRMQRGYKIWQGFLPILVFLGLVLASVLVHGQDDQSGFISIDCGMVEGPSYTDNRTGINYVSDVDFIDSGEIHTILPIYNSFTIDKQLITLSSFPQNTRNCYTLKPNQGKGNRYLIRARFMYGNYDFNGQLPEFDVYLGPDYWDTMKLNSSSKPVSMEIIHVPSSDYIHVCLVNTGRGTPFISAIELRLLASNMYEETNFGSLYLFARVNFGTTFRTFRSTDFSFLDSQLRYNADKYDRLWSPINWPNSTFLYTLDKVSTGFFTAIVPPSEVMSTAITPRYPTDSFNIRWNSDNTTDKFFTYIHFAEIEILKRNQTREFNIYMNGNHWYGPFSPLNHTTTTIHSTGPETVAPKYTLTINKTKNSTLPPIINALELYTVMQLPQRQTDDRDGNNFIGTVPAGLLAKANKGSLSLSFDSESTGVNASSCDTNPCKSKKDNKIIVPVIATVASLIVILIALTTIWTIKKQIARGKRKTGTGLEIRKQQYAYSEVQSLTDNFSVVIGKGGFGTVYHGYIGDIQVAVKMLSKSSLQGDKEFQAEVYLLLSVHHKNLTSLVGYCNEGRHKAIIYEYMANGNLERHLFGLEYLHHGCKPPIVHRDVKCTNILLNGTFQAKLSDFGLSKAFPTEVGSHISTAVAGTPGYLDPEYYTANRLTEKSDVYSFGVVLLVVITGQPAITKYDTDNIHISRWVNLMLAEGNVKDIIDPRLLGDFDINSAWKAVELAMACVAHTPSRRPSMNEVMMELNDCLVLDC
ncbi:Concanavalin A-like lectin/glucanase, subgroup [Cynara cardunculus var. scolymus]|uniref:non-specific serine/threonine protein kinase n=1 Tax=Cynara cardunculus var. scolymus TaxID=59895 RepID=A0A118K3G2_CYNCS|nr:Concanavalin A-like lectin/glucanase, subgroup [Cynara cardunculus var. scolymus]